MTRDAAPAFTQLCQALGGVPAWTTKGSLHWISVCAIRVGTVEVRATPRFGSKGGFFGATFAIDLTHQITDAPITLRRERELDRLGKRLRINREVQTGDAAFDSAVYIESSASDDTILRALSSSTTRAAVLAALASGSVFTSLVIGAASSPSDNGGVSADVDAGPVSQPPAIWRGLSDLARLLDGFANAETEAGGPYGRGRGLAPKLVPARPSPRIRIAVAAVFVFALGVATVAIPTPTTLDALPSRIGAFAGGVAWLMTAGLMVVLFRGRSTSLRIVLAFTLAYFVLIPFGARVFERINADADSGPATKHRGIARVVVRSKGPNVVSLDIPWRSGSPNVTVAEGDVHGGLFFPSSGAREVIVTTHPGALGGEWISDIALEK